MADVDILHELLPAVIKAYGESSDRTQQSEQGIIGPSDLGFCRQKAALMTKGVPQSDSKEIAAAQMGTAIHTYIAEVFREFFPNWIVDNQRLTATFPSGVQVSGTPDAVGPDYNIVIDVKTVDGFEYIRRAGPSENHIFQRHTYALAAIQAGLLDETKTIYVANLYIDRSGKEATPLLKIEEYDPTLTDVIDNWIDDVMYAVKNDEDASRDIVAPVCEKICSYYSVCRGGFLPVLDGQEIFEDAERVEAMAMYIEGREMAKRGETLRKEGSEILHGMNGVAKVGDDLYQIRWTEVQSTTVEAYERAGYLKADVRKVKAPKG